MRGTSMRWWRLNGRRALLLALAGGATLLPSPAGTMAAGPDVGQQPGSGRAVAAEAATGAPRVRALVVSGGCCHQYVRQDALTMEIIGRTVPADWTVVLQGGTARESKIPLYERSDWIEGFDIVLHNECFGFVDDAAYIRTITEAHRRTGVPAVFTHCSMHSYRNAAIDDWRELIGVTSRRHTAAHPIAVTWTDPGHPLVSGLRPGWTTPIDELYVIEKTWPGVNVLATAVSPEADNPVFPVAWTQTAGNVRVFGTTLGHQETWNDPVFQDLLTRGFTWALGR